MNTAEPDAPPNGLETPRNRIGERRAAILDIAGFAVFAGLAGWTILTGAVSGGDPASVVGLVAVSGMGILVGRVAGTRDRIIVPTAIAVVAVIPVLVMGSDLAGGPVDGPFGYANATGAFYALAAVAAVMVALEARSNWIRAVAWAAVIGFAGVVIASSSIAASLLVVTLPLLALGFGKARRARAAIGLFACLFAGAVLLTVVIGVAYPSRTPAALDDAIAHTIGARRAVLWRDAAVIMGSEPVTGAGLGSFQILSPTARTDADARWAHNEFLQLGAETGVPGLILLVLVFGWVFMSLWVAGGTAAALGAAAAAAIGMHASIDYILHFPAIPIAAAALVGSASARRAIR